MKKRGMLLTEETLKIIIAVIGIAILVYLLVSLFYSGVNTKKEREARASIETISEIIDSTLGDFRGVQPYGWYLFSFVGEEKKPDLCTEKNCVCICRKVVADVFNRQAKQCNKNTACLAVSNLVGFEPIKIERKGITNIKISKTNGGIAITEIP